MGGLGPTSDISPSSTLKNCGNSSRLVRRRNRPMGVTRGSRVSLNVVCPFCSTFPRMNCVTYSSWMRGSLAGYMDRNLRNVKPRPYWPSLFCRNKTGPFEVALIAAAITRSAGERSPSAKRLPAMSIDRFSNRERFCAPLRPAISGYSVRSAGSPGSRCSQSSGNRWNAMLTSLICSMLSVPASVLVTFANRAFVTDLRENHSQNASFRVPALDIRFAGGTRQSECQPFENRRLVSGPQKAAGVQQHQDKASAGALGPFPFQVEHPPESRLRKEIWIRSPLGCSELLQRRFGVFLSAGNVPHRHTTPFPRLSARIVKANREALTGRVNAAPLPSRLRKHSGAFVGRATALLVPLDGPVPELARKSSWLADLLLRNLRSQFECHNRHSG